MKALKTFLKKSLILLLAIALNHLNAVAMIVDNPTQNIWQQAKDAIDKSRFVQQVNHWADQIKKYQDMIEKAQTTINQLNKVNDILCYPKPSVTLKKLFPIVMRCHIIYCSATPCAESYSKLFYQRSFYR